MEMSVFYSSFFLFWTTTQSESKTLVFHGNPEPGTAAVRLLCSTLVSAAAIHSQTNTSDFLAFRFSSPTLLVRDVLKPFFPDLINVVSRYQVLGQLSQECVHTLFHLGAA